jgi:hypothetical protein
MPRRRRGCAKDGKNSIQREWWVFDARGRSERSTVRDTRVGRVDWCVGWRSLQRNVGWVSGGLPT